MGLLFVLNFSKRKSFEFRCPLDSKTFFFKVSLPGLFNIVYNIVTEVFNFFQIRTDSRSFYIAEIYVSVSGLVFNSYPRIFVRSDSYDFIGH